MHDFHDIAQRAMMEYRRQPGLVSVEVEGEPPCGLRYRFRDVSEAGRFRNLRSIQHAYEQGSKFLDLDGCDVVETWG